MSRISPFVTNQLQPSSIPNLSLWKAERDVFIDLDVGDTLEIEAYQYKSQPRFPFQQQKKESDESLHSDDGKPSTQLNQGGKVTKLRNGLETPASRNASNHQLDWHHFKGSDVQATAAYLKAEIRSCLSEIQFSDCVSRASDSSLPRSPALTIAEPLMHRDTLSECYSRLSAFSYVIRQFLAAERDQLPKFLEIQQVSGGCLNQLHSSTIALITSAEESTTSFSPLGPRRNTS